MMKKTLLLFDLRSNKTYVTWNLGSIHAPFKLSVKNIQYFGKQPAKTVNLSAYLTVLGQHVLSSRVGN